FADRYGDRIDYYQLWDEPNIAPHWGNRHIEPVEYARLLYMAGQAIRAADADAQIMTAALAPTADRGHTAIDEIYFLQRLYASAREFDTVSSDRFLTTLAPAIISTPAEARLFDAVAVEPFGFDYSVLDSRQRLELLNFQRVQLVRRAMVAAGDAETPLWAARFGWNTRPDSPWGVVSAADQARFAQQAVALAQSQWPWLDAMGWAIDQPDAPATDPIWGFALNDQLLDAFTQSPPIASTVEPLAVDALSPHRFWLHVGLLVFLWALIAWRTRAAWRHINVSAWVYKFPAHVIIWAILVWLYVAAVWPPLIGLCWLGFVWLAWRAPLNTLYVAAAALPFYFQHKELAIVDWRWQIPPAYMLLTALLPALIGDGGRRAFIKTRNAHSNDSPQRQIARRFWLRRSAIALFRLHPLDWLALAWLGINLASSSNVWHWPAYWQGLTEQALAPLLFYVAVRMWAADAAAQRRVAIWLFGGGLLAALWGWAGWLDGAGTLADGVRRLVGPHFSPNHTALYLERTLFLGIGLALGTQELRQNGWRQWAWRISCAVVMGALLLTFSRGALLIALPAGALLFFLYAPTRGRITFWAPQWQRRHWYAVTFVGALLIFFFWLIADRLTNSDSVMQRFESWRVVWRLWRDYPLLGVGPGGFFWRYPAYTLENGALDPNLRHPHNVWLEFAASWGVMGIGWLLALCWLLWRQLHRLELHADINAKSATSLRTLAICWLIVGMSAGLVAGLMHGQVDAFMALADLAGWNWLALAILATSSPRASDLHLRNVDNTACK
ncbi:MAG: O-antigen ligase family protein, partial [Caldilineaceae bacterium]|nr:O-antigen ligase family protein [Caldilineaceae bacterium]